MDHYHYQRNYYNMLLRKYRGTTFRDYVQAVRMETACTLLTTTDLPIREIAHRVGYENISHFYHLFEKNLGMPPAEYRSHP